ncbi:MAG: SDR family NAD(P)-dependent oxidoreductase [Hydrogenophaga sp.]|uniref:type I polyketide synthase n=1 Tax=Hydrogenophaga sp. TaxID=1904254 RepID=UPI001E026A1A|nr:type I polyketide synthase [Hydrogenophaga sp.]MBX3611468.1 SDR family NAD(P)-dependent oxidoreductase [Hydrogenophaga sp.]
MPDNAVAIVGIGCRWPGAAHGPADFWQMLCDGKDAIAEIPPDRIDLGRYFDPRPATPGRMMTRWGGFLDAIQTFDADFFGISPREAERMDPQQRLLLETAWEALEDAGFDASSLEGSQTGVFVGQWLSDFEARLFADPEAVDFLMTTGSGRYASSGRLSYLLGLRGPSLTLDTACSSSLAAVHLAARSVRSGESDLAIAGGVNIILQPHISVAYSQSRMMAPDGRCKFGDARGDGYVRSEGAGVVVLKPLARALADGDRIYALVRGSALNNDGRSSGSMGTPSQAGQEALLRSACADAGVAPAAIDYVEAHGTGTRAGDPVELGAIGTVLGEARERGRPVHVGSVKTNIGHTEGAAGVAGLIKAALALHHERIPQSLHCQQPNPAIDWDGLGVAIAREAMTWPRGDHPRRAGVSAFGIAGTNAHVVLEEAPEPQPRASEVPNQRPSLLVLSARDAAALRELAGRFALLLERGAHLTDVCHSAARRRTHHEHRAAFVAHDAMGMAEALRQYADGGPAAAQGRAVPGQAPRLAFVCPGQGAQWPGMARGLMASEPVFMDELLRCDEAARPWMEASIVAQLGLEPGDPDSLLDRIDVVQPVLVALALAYAALLRACGVRPDAVVGHSMGEVAAAAIAGVLSRDDAMRIICRRSALMSRTSGQGAMALVDLPMSQVQQRLAGHEAEVSVAVSNSPRSCVISGQAEVVKSLIAGWSSDNVFCRLINVDVASHSPQMDPLAQALRAELGDLNARAVDVPLFSTVLARQAEPHELGAAYWGDNLRQPVRFGATVEGMLAEGIAGFIELGPHPVLLPSIEQTAQAADVEVMVAAPARRGEPDLTAWLSTVGALHCAGHQVNWAQVVAPGGRLTDLPAYPWQRERHWVDAAELAASGAPAHGLAVPGHHPVLGAGVALGGTPAGALWALSIDPGRVPAWFEHRLHGSPVLPASAYLELAFAAAAALIPGASFELVRLSFDRALHLQTDAACSLQLLATPDGNGGLRLGFQSHTGTTWQVHAVAELRAGSGFEVERPSANAIQALQQKTADAADAVYGQLASVGAGIGERLRGIASAWIGPEEVLSRLTDSPVDEPAAIGFGFVPAALDACMQTAVLLALSSGLCVPVSVERVIWHRQSQGARWVHARRRVSGEPASPIDLTLFDEQGPVLSVVGVQLQAVGELGAVQSGDPCYELRWITQEGDANAAAANARRWLALADRSGQGRLLVDALTRLGEVAEVVDAHRAVDAPAVGSPAIEWVDLRALDLASPQAVVPGLGLLVRTAQALERWSPAVSARLHWVTRGSQVTDDQDVSQLAMSQTPVNGLAAVMAVELGSRWGGVIDLDPGADPVSGAEALALALVQSAGTCALRSGRRLRPSLQNVDAPTAMAPVNFRPDASYVVTGGLGGVGGALARWLVAQGVRHLVVLSRTPVPARLQWAGLTADSPAAPAVRALRDIEALGASVQHVALDVADEAALQTWLASHQAQARPPVRGLFHLAGITEDRLVRDLDESSLAAVLRPKLTGAWNLHRLLPELDHFVMFSSMAGVMPQAGQGSYAAANAFLDSLARQRRATGQAALSIGWGVWAGTGVMQGEGGRRQQDELLRQGIGSFTVQQATSLLPVLLQWPQAHVLAMPIDWQRMRAQPAWRDAPLLMDLLAQVQTVQADGSSADIPTTSDPLERRRAVEQAVRDVVGRVLKVQPSRIDPRKPLGNMGMTSLMALELRNRLEPLHGKPLSATLAWNYPTVEALVTFLAGADAAPAVPPASPTAAAGDTPPALADVLDDVNALSDDDAALLLRKRR